MQKGSPLQPMVVQLLWFKGKMYVCVLLPFRSFSGAGAEGRNVAEGADGENISSMLNMGKQEFETT